MCSATAEAVPQRQHQGHGKLVYTHILPERERASNKQHRAFIEVVHLSHTTWLPSGGRRGAPMGLAAIAAALLYMRAKVPAGATTTRKGGGHPQHPQEGVGHPSGGGACRPWRCGKKLAVVQVPEEQARCGTCN